MCLYMCYFSIFIWASSTSEPQTHCFGRFGLTASTVQHNKVNNNKLSIEVLMFDSEGITNIQIVGLAVTADYRLLPLLPTNYNF